MLFTTKLTYWFSKCCSSLPSVYIPLGGCHWYVCLFMCYGSYHELIWWQCVSAIDPCVPHLVGTHTQPAVTAVQSGDHHAKQTPKHTHTITHTHTQKICTQRVEMDSLNSLSLSARFAYFNHIPVLIVRLQSGQIFFIQTEEASIAIFYLTF